MLLIIGLVIKLTGVIAREDVQAVLGFPLAVPLSTSSWGLFSGPRLPCFLRSCECYCPQNAGVSQTPTPGLCLPKSTMYMHA